MNEYGPIRRPDAPVYIPPLVGYVPRGRLDEVGAWLLALRLTGDTWDCLIVWVRTTLPLNGRDTVHIQELAWVPATAVRKLLAYSDEYDQVPRLRQS